MSRIVLTALGSLGDLHPYLGVAAGLKARGHDLIVVSNGELHRQRVESEGYTFHPVRPDPAAVSADDRLRPTDRQKDSHVVIKNLLRYADQTYDDLMDVCRTADLFVTHPGAFSAPLVAEKLKLPWLSIALAPATLFSVHDPPVLPSMPWLTQLARFGSLPHSLIFRAFKRHVRGWMQPLDDLRRRVGLPPASQHPFFEGMFSPYGTLGWFSSLLAAPQTDWPPACQVTGFPLPDNNRTRPELPPDLAAFLDAGEPPVVFSLGSVIVKEAGDFYSQSLAAARLIGCRAVFLAGADPRNYPAGASSDSTFFTAYAPHAGLFPQAAAVVHQGGVSTLSEAMSAGLPMLIVPHLWDQHDNAFRAAKLGIARTESREKYQSPRVAAHLRALLEQPEYRASARRVKAHVDQENGVDRACAAIETTLAQGTQLLRKAHPVSR